MSMKGITAKMVREMYAAKGGGPQPPLWEGTHLATHHTLTLKQRSDRHLLVSLYEQSRQICQWVVAKHGEVNSNLIIPNDTPAVAATAKFATPFCVMYAEGQIKDSKELKQAVKIEYKRIGEKNCKAEA